MKYKKKPVAIEAFQFDGDFLKEAMVNIMCQSGRSKHLKKEFCTLML